MSTQGRARKEWKKAGARPAWPRSSPLDFPWLAVMSAAFCFRPQTQRRGWAFRSRTLLAVVVGESWRPRSRRLLQNQAVGTRGVSEPIGARIRGKTLTGRRGRGSQPWRGISLGCGADDPRAGSRDIHQGRPHRPRRPVSVFPRRSPCAYRLRYASSSDRLTR